MIFSNKRIGLIKAQQGASLVEFSIIAPVIALMGKGTLQAGLLYHNKTILNYATYEAARVGATRHAQPASMRRELGIRLAPIIGGDGSLEKAALAMAQTAIEVESPIGINGAFAPPTKLEILSPSLETFASWGQESLEYSSQLAIPNSHIRHQGNEVRGGLTLADANLLKIEVTHGMEMKVPLVGKMLSAMMLVLDDNEDHRLYYLSQRFPLTSTATVRMQSEALEGAIVAARDKPYGEFVASLSAIAADIEAAAVDALSGDDEGDADSLTGGGEAGDCDANGVPLAVDNPESVSGMCPIAVIGDSGIC